MNSCKSGTTCIVSMRFGMFVCTKKHRVGSMCLAPSPVTGREGLWKEKPAAFEVMLLMNVFFLDFYI